jgi:hypothetical protein
MICLINSRRQYFLEMLFELSASFWLSVSESSVLKATEDLKIIEHVKVAMEAATSLKMLMESDPRFHQSIAGTLHTALAVSID